MNGSLGYIFCFGAQPQLSPLQLWPSLLISLWLIAGLIKPGILGRGVSVGLFTLKFNLLVLTQIQ